ncbi:MAG: AAA family ATPase [Lachnospiraceae bacterium]
MEKKQIIISIGREFGSGGRVIAKGLSERFGIPFYDKDILREIAAERNVDVKTLQEYDEVPKTMFFSRTVRGYSNSPEENIAHLQFNYLRKMAEDGKSFVIVGRCSEEVLKEYDALIPVFVLGDMDKKIERIQQLHHLTEEEAEDMILSTDKKRKGYHNYYCKRKWGDSRNYDLCINSSRLGIEGTVDILESYIRERIK